MLIVPMETATAISPAAEPVTPTASAKSIVPWYGWVAVGGVACLPIGMLWDISWHETIGRDTFWTPAHIVIQLGGIIPAFLFAWLALKTTFRGTEAERAASVGIFGFRAPLGAWVTMWGAAMMLTSAPFDDWWHNTYGLDVQIISPPHSVLGTGMIGVAIGVLLFVFSQQNRAQTRQQKSSALLCALAAGVMVTIYSVFTTEESFPNQQRWARFYMVSAVVYPVWLVLAARASQMRWPATIAAATYMGTLMLMIWILPLFPGHPKLAPIYHPVDHMVPPPFPHFLLLPALGIDLVMQAMRRFGLAGSRTHSTIGESGGGLWQWLGMRDWLLALGLAAVFVTIFISVQWFFSAFLLSDAADNWFFARDGHWPYFSHVGEHANSFWVKRTPTGGVEDQLTLTNLAIVLGLALGSSRIGLSCGSYLQRVRR
jgi:hypothetical protein